MDEKNPEVSNVDRVTRWRKGGGREKAKNASLPSRWASETAAGARPGFRTQAVTTKSRTGGGPSATGSV